MKRFVTYDLLVVYQNGGSDLYHPSVHDNADTIEELLSETDKYLKEKVPDWGIVQVQFKDEELDEWESGKHWYRYGKNRTNDLGWTVSD